MLFVTSKTQGLSLKKRALKRWIYANGYNQPRFARALGLSTNAFKRKLNNHEKFNEYQIRCLVKLMKAKAAFRVLYFPSLKVRRRIYQKVFGSIKGGIV